MMHQGVCSSIIESRHATKAMEGHTSMAEEGYGCRIRPSPPRHSLNEYEITFGLCVNDFVEDSSLKGVMDGSKIDYGNLLVFFPDTGDKILVCGSKDRRHLGLWFSPQIAKDLRPKKIVLSKIMEMWLRQKDIDTFREKVKIWYSGSKHMWKELVLDVIRGMKSPVSRLPLSLSSSSVEQRNVCWAHGRVGRSSNEGGFSLASINHTCRCYSATSNQLQKVEIIYTRKQKNLEPHILGSGEKFISGAESYAEMEVDGHHEDERLRNNGGDGEIVSSNVSDIKLTLENKEDKKSLASRGWELVELEGEHCHDLLELSCSSQSEFKTHVNPRCIRIHKVKLRKHLVSCGWRIESKRDTLSRFRYISPEKRIYYSLDRVFQCLLKGKTEMSGETRDKSNSKPRAIPSDAGFLATQQTADLLYGESDSSGLMNRKVIHSNCLELIGEKTQAPIDCSTTINETLNKVEDAEALNVIKSYVGHIKKLEGEPKLSVGDAKDLRSKTKNHLLEKGWKFWLYDKKVRLELRYTSPNGRTYLSLYTACKGYLEEAHCENNGVSNNLTSITPINKEGLEHGPHSFSNLSESSDCDSNEQFGSKRKLKRRKIKHEKSLMMQKSSILSVSGEFDSKKRRGRKRKVKMRTIDYQNSPNFSFSKLPHSGEFDSKDHLDRKQELKRRKTASRVLGSGKRTRWADVVLSSKDQANKTALSWLLDKDVVLPRQKVAFVRKTDGRILKEGWITHNGIKCRCCSNVFPLSQFGAHAGSRSCRPSASIILQDGRSLLDCQRQILSAFKPNKFQHGRLRGDYSNHEADDTCTVCRDGGLLMLCDLCPSAFHPTCAGLEDVPVGQWFCPSCRCGICGLSEFNCDSENFTQNSGIYCDQCERQYHVGCLQQQGLQLEKCPTGTWTCSKACSKIISHLQFLLGKSNLTHVKGLHWTILRSNIDDIGNLDDESLVENSGMLHIALDVLHECFETMVEARTQSDLATDIIFNNTSELNRLNFRGFYTMLLMSGDELIGVATFRIFGERLAEMPFIGIRVKFRRQGMCRILMNELQKLLSSLGVERLMLPAIPELLKTWTSSFGFTEMTSSDRLELLEHTLLTFQGTTMCQKFLKKKSSASSV